MRTRGEDDFGSTPDFKLIKYAPLGHIDSGQNAFICCFAYTGYFHSLRFRSPVCARRNIFLPSFPLFRSNGGEIDLTTGNRIYKSFPQRVILLRNETTERERERERVVRNVTLLYPWIYSFCSISNFIQISDRRLATSSRWDSLHHRQFVNHSFVRICPAKRFVNYNKIGHISGNKLFVEIPLVTQS